MGPGSAADVPYSDAGMMNEPSAEELEWMASCIAEQEAADADNYRTATARVTTSGKYGRGRGNTSRTPIRERHAIVRGRGPVC